MPLHIFTLYTYRGRILVSPEFLTIRPDGLRSIVRLRRPANERRIQQWAERGRLPGM